MSARKGMAAKTIGEGVGLIAVVASMVFVGLEIRQNTIAAQAAAYQQLGSSTAELWRFGQDPTRANVAMLASDSSRWSEVDDVGWTQMGWYMGEGLRIWETLFLQVQSGLLPEEALERFGWGSDPYTLWPYFDRFWPAYRVYVDEDFADFVDGRTAQRR